MAASAVLRRPIAPSSSVRRRSGCVRPSVDSFGREALIEHTIPWLDRSKMKDDPSRAEIYIRSRRLGTYGTSRITTAPVGGVATQQTTSGYDPTSGGISRSSHIRHRQGIDACRDAAISLRCSHCLSNLERCHHRRVGVDPVHAGIRDGQPAEAPSHSCRCMSYVRRHELGVAAPISTSTRSELSVNDG